MIRCLKRKSARNYFAFWQVERLNFGMKLGRRQGHGWVKTKIKEAVLRELASRYQSFCKIRMNLFLGH